MAQKSQVQPRYIYFGDNTVYDELGERVYTKPV